MSRCFVLLGTVLLSWSSLIFANQPSLHDKIGQMLILGFDGKTVTNKSPVAERIAKHNLGGVILFDYNRQTERFDKNIESPEQVAKLNRDLQSVTNNANKTHHRPDLPLLISVDYEGGMVTRLQEEYGFPHTDSAKTVGSMPMTQAKAAALTMANTLSDAGFNLDFAPVLDVDSNPENPIISKKERSYSADPTLVATYAGVFSEALKAKKVQCAYKHFPGHGSANGDSHLGFVDITDTWHERELIPYERLLQTPSACGVIMSAHLINRRLDASGVPATLSHEVLTDLLREQLHFNGVVVSDDMQMKAIADNYGLETAVTMAVNAGVDMLVFGNQLSDDVMEPDVLIALIEKQVTDGKISESRINEAYERIVRLKQSMTRPNNLSQNNADRSDSRSSRYKYYRLR